MCDIEIMQVDESINYVLEETNSLFGGKHPNFILVIKESSSTQVFQHQINVLFFLEETVKLDDVGMFKSTVQSNLSNELVHHLHIDQFFLYYFLYGNNEACLDMFRHVHLTELSFPQYFTKLEALDHSIFGLYLRLGPVFDGINGIFDV